MPSSKNPRDPLEEVHEFYELHNRLWDIIESKIRGPEQITEATKITRAIRTKMKKIDMRYIGGDDVFQGTNQLLHVANQTIFGKKSDQVNFDIAA